MEHRLLGGPRRPVHPHLLVPLLLLPLLLGSGGGVATCESKPGDVQSAAEVDALPRNQQFLRCLDATDEILQAVSKLDSLAYLEVHGDRLTDQGVRAISSLKKLVSLTVADCPGVGDAALQAAGGLTELRSLNLAGTAITDAGAAHLRTLLGLTLLNLSATTLGNRALEGFAELPELQFLDLGGTRVTDEGLGALARLPMLRVLELAECDGITDVGLAHLKDLQALGHVNLQRTRITNAGLETLAGIPNLQRISLEESAVTDAAAAALRQVNPGCFVALGALVPGGGTKLPTAVLRTAEDTGKLRAGIRAVRCPQGGNELLAAALRIPRIARIDLGAAGGLTDDGLAQVGKNAGLAALRAAGATQLTDRGLGGLTGLSGLRELSLEGATGITDAGIPHLAKLADLRALDLSGTGVTEKGLAGLASLPRLRRLQLRATKLAEEALRAVRKALPACEVVAE